jgi:hypothetical protein
MMDLNLKLQATSTKSLAKAIEFELRKEHAAEAEEQLKIVKVFQLNTLTNSRRIFLMLLNQSDRLSKASSGLSDFHSKPAFSAPFS